MTRTLQLTEQLVSRPSVTPNDGGCQRLIAERLKAGEPIASIHDVRGTAWVAGKAEADAIAARASAMAMMSASKH